MVVRFDLSLCIGHGDSCEIRLGHFEMRNGPFKATLCEESLSFSQGAVANTNENTVGCEHSVDLTEHLLRVNSCQFSAQDRVIGTFVNDRVEESVLVLQLAHIHLLVRDHGVLFLVVLCHVLDHTERDVDVVDVLVALLKHLLAHARVACSHIKDLVLWLHILSYDLSKCSISLVPVKKVLVVLVTVLPEISLTVLRHYFQSLDSNYNFNCNYIAQTIMQQFKRGKDLE